MPLSCPRCYNCGLWGHTQSTCARQAKCGHCAGSHDTRKCHQTEKSSCSNCGRKHKQWDRSCPVYQTARATADARRRALFEETYRIRIQASRNTFAGEPHIRSQPALSAPAAGGLPSRSVGRPRGINKAAAAAGQQSLAWARPTVEEEGEEMEMEE